MSDKQKSSHARGRPYSSSPSSHVPRHYSQTTDPKVSKTDPFYSDSIINRFGEEETFLRDSSYIGHPIHNSSPPSSCHSTTQYSNGKSPESLPRIYHKDNFHYYAAPGLMMDSGFGNNPSIPGAVADRSIHNRRQKRWAQNHHHHQGNPTVLAESPSFSNQYTPSYPSVETGIPFKEPSSPSYYSPTFSPSSPQPSSDRRSQRKKKEPRTSSATSKNYHTQPQQLQQNPPYPYSLFPPIVTSQFDSIHSIPLLPDSASHGVLVSENTQMPK